MTATGTVNARYEAVVRLRLRGPTGVEAEVAAIVDTAFNGWLALPLDIAVDVLGLTRRTTGNAKMGDGSARGFDVFAADVWWSGTSRTVSAAGVGHDPLVGMRFLAGGRLTIDVTPGGAVAVASLAP